MRRTGSRTTVIRSSDPRAAGYYEQSADWPSVEAMYRTIAPTLDDDHSVTITGLVDLPGPLRYSDLVALATSGRDDSFKVSLADLLAAVRLDARADVLIVTALCGTPLAIPVRDVLHSDAAQLTLGTTRAALRSNQGGPIRLDVRGWSTPADCISVVAVRVMTFEEFVGCW